MSAEETEPFEPERAKVKNSDRKVTMKVCGKCELVVRSDNWAIHWKLKHGNPHAGERIGFVRGTKGSRNVTMTLVEYEEVT